MDKKQISDLPITIFMWVYEIFLYSLALPLFLGLVLGIFEGISIFYNWFFNFSWAIKIPVFIVVGIYLRSILKSRYFTGENKLYVGNLSIYLTSEQLKELFSNYDKVKNMKHYQDKGFAFIEMSSPEEAKKAKNTLKDANPSLFLVIV